MKILTLILLLLLSWVSIGQTIEETAKVFWEALDNNNNKVIIEKGEILIKYIDDNNFELDTNFIKIRVFTANSYSSLGLINESLQLNIQTLEMCQKKSGTHHGYSTVVINNIAKNYSSLGDFTKALEFSLTAIDIYEKTLGKEHPSYAIGLSNAAHDYTNIGDFNKALEYDLIALDIKDKTLGKEHPAYVSNLYNLAKDYDNLGNYTQALKFNLLALEARKKTLGKDHPDYARTLISSALNYSSLGSYNKALELSLTALDIRKKNLGKEHPLYANNLIVVASNYSKLSDNNKALELNLLALGIYEKTIGKEHSYYALCISNIAGNHQGLGDFNKALEYKLIALDIYVNAKGKEHPNYSIYLSGIAGSYFDIGNYTKSLEYNLRALEIFEKTLGKEHPDYASSLNNIALVYSDLGEHNKSLEYNLIALEIFEKAYGKEHPDYAACLNNISINYNSLGDYNKSLENKLIVLELAEKIFGKEHPSYALSLNNIALSFSNQGEYRKALEYDLLALNIYKKQLGKEHPSYAHGLSNIGNDYFELDDNNKALSFYLEALNIRGQTLGKNHIENAQNLGKISLNYFKLEKYNKALESRILSCKITLQHFIKNKFGLTPQIQNSFKETIELRFHHLANITYFDDSAISDVYDNWIELNGIIGSDQNRFKEEVQSSEDSLLIQLFDDLKLSQLQLVKFNEMTFQEREEKGIDTESIEKHIAERETELSKRSQSFAEMNRSFSSKDAVKHLNDDEVLIDIVRFPYYDHINNEWSDSVKYLVFILSSQGTTLDYLYIDGGKKLEEEVFANYSSFTSGSNNNGEVKDEMSYEFFWKPISDKIGDNKTVYISLSGIYNNINLNTLYNLETEKYLLEEKDIRIVNSARDFILSKEREKKEYTNTTAALFGYPNYDGISTAISDSNDYLAIYRDLNTFWLDSLNRGGMTAKPLPGTKTEVENITLTFKEKNWNVSTFIGNSASETAVKQIQSPRVVHIATHGYFFDDIPTDKSETRFMGMEKQQLVQDPLLRSGLLFTGANKTLQGEATKGDNGLLSAAEASLLNLRETELVVLSACETGRGEVKNSEGVYGLRKAMSDAGATNTIMSLWKVDDKVTQEFMTTFYSTWLSGKTIREAFNETQLTIKEKYPQPYYWGAFILIGE